ncbi:SPOR domain-containing protein [Thiotrichales bacterium 19S9-12]|nr:SPOR domain-containing protein [Thiotrichales bacterium 19S9-11]MCF6812604.1 SPOR domain-containing protein [Thiotrichales bacterium 19S9-12]
MMRDYARNTASKQPAAKLKTHNRSDDTSHPSNKRAFKNNFKRLLQAIDLHHKNKTEFAKKSSKKTAIFKKRTNLKSKLTKKTKASLTSFSVLIILGSLTLILVLLLFYVMSHKKTTEIKSVTLHKPASFLNPPKFDLDKPTSTITIPLNSSDKTETLAENQENTTNQTSSASNDKPKFTFYNTLTSNTVDVDATPKAQKEYKYTYALQVASYKNESDANSMRARLLLIGLNPTILKKGNYYVVSIRNITSKRDGDIIKHRLESNKIQGSILVQTSKTPITQGQ